MHANGDLLIISDFSNGGTTSLITVYKWDTTCTAANKPVAACADSNLRTLASSDAAKCTTAGGADAFCGIVNPGTITMPWSFTDKSGTPANGALNGEFYEGGVNLSTLGLGNECFSSVASETRSSTSTTSVLKDFVLSNFGQCNSGLSTTPKDGAGADIPPAGLPIGNGSVSVKDAATLGVTGTAVWTGTLKFFLCGPIATGTCTTGGTQIGATATVTNATVQPILSTAATVTSAGRYCWRSEFASGTSGVPSATESSATECFTVNPVTPAIPTQASGAVAIGAAVSDTANLSGTSNKPGTGGSAPINPTTPGAAAGGTITFRLYGPSATAVCTAANLVFTSAAITVSGNGAYGSGNFTPASAGTYYWVASYTGDAPNTNAAAGACGDSNESVVISPKTPTIVTNAVAGPLPIGSNVERYRDDREYGAQGERRPGGWFGDVPPLRPVCDGRLYGREPGVHVGGDHGVR